MNLSEPRTIEYIIMWDMYGLESLINITDAEQQAIVQVLKDEPVTWRNPIQYMLLRARLNSQRHYEIYRFQSDLTETEIKRLFNVDAQTIADAIRRVGIQLYSDRLIKDIVIT